MLTLHNAATQYNIPKSTLHDRLKNKTKIKSQSLGRSTALPEKEENKLANGLKILEKWGFGLSRKEVIFMVSKFVARNNIITPFKNNTPGADWFQNLKKRHNLSITVPQPVEYARKKMTDPFIVDDYFQKLNSTLEELQLQDSPDQIWNLDETSICLDPQRINVVGARGTPSSRTTSGTGKENYTVLCCVSASGNKAPPLIIFKGKYVWDQWMATESDDKVAYAATKKGWMESDIFLNYLKKNFIPFIGASDRLW